MPYILAGDVGGTNSRFMLYDVSWEMQLIKGSRAPGILRHSQTYTNEGVNHFTEQLKRFFGDAGCLGAPPTEACIAIAGPVVENVVTMTNRGWVISGKQLEEELGIGHVRLVNDFVAAGYGLLTLNLDSEVRILQEGKRIEGQPIACIGSGTGLGETFLTCPVGGGEYDAYPTEGGHAELAPRSALEFKLVEHIKAAHNGRCSVERVVSGSGLVNVYEFLAKEFPDRVDPVAHEAIETAGDMKGKMIAHHGKTDAGSLCEQVMRIWVTHYGSEAGVAALKHIPYGGLFLAGGMTPKNIDLLTEGGSNGPFMKAFADKGRVSGILKDIPVYAVMEEDIGQRGAHLVAFSMFKKDEEAKHQSRSFSPGQLVSVTALAAMIGLASGKVFFGR